jgi:hypothetical protein
LRSSMNQLVRDRFFCSAVAFGMSQMYERNERLQKTPPIISANV